MISKYMETRRIHYLFRRLQHLICPCERDKKRWEKLRMELNQGKKEKRKTQIKVTELFVSIEKWLLAFYKYIVEPWASMCVVRAQLEENFGKCFYTRLLQG